MQYDADGNVKDVVRANLTQRVVRLPRGADTCRGAERGDLLTIRFAAAYEVPGTSDEVKAQEASVDLLRDPYGSERWAVFDSSAKRGMSFYLPLEENNAIPGVLLGLQGMCQGEQRVLYIPAPLAYGSRGNRVFEVPPDARVRYDVSVESVMNMGPPSRSPSPGTRRVVGQLVD